MKRNQQGHNSTGIILTSLELKEKLEYHYQCYDRKNISPDPLKFPHRFSNPGDIELVAFLASVFAFGNVKQISKVMENILLLLGENPVDWLKSASSTKPLSEFAGLHHRFYRGEDTTRLMLILKSALNQFGSLESLIKKITPRTDWSSPKAVIGKFHSWFNQECDKFGGNTPGLRFMIPNPSSGSSCKRFNLLLRWMVRKDELDFGLWSFISPAELVIPVDTHIAQIARSLGLTLRKNPDWKMAEEITNRLKEFEPNDPVKYDFSLCHIGIRGLEF